MARRTQAATDPLIAIAAAPPFAAPSPPRSPAEVDPQFLELFIEEAKEEIAAIQQTFPLWDQNPMDLESLASLRRSFHTLKGSGRMVGARSIAEFGWSIENLLNRLIDKTLSRTPGMMGLLRNAVAALPTLVEQLESGRQTSVGVETLMSRAFAYADGREAEQLGRGPRARGSSRFRRFRRVRGADTEIAAGAVQAGAPQHFRAGVFRRRGRERYRGRFLAAGRSRGHRRPRGGCARVVADGSAAA